MQKTKYNFIREHADKEVLDKVQIEFYIFILKLLEEKPNLTDQTSS